MRDRFPAGGFRDAATLLRPPSYERAGTSYGSTGSLGGLDLQGGLLLRVCRGKPRRVVQAGRTPRHRDGKDGVATLTAQIRTIAIRRPLTQASRIGMREWTVVQVALR